MLHRGTLAIALLLSLLLPQGLPGAAGATQPPPRAKPGRDDPWSTCQRNILVAERQQEVPERLLQAISHAESGRWDQDRQRMTAWPWTVMAEGRGRYLDSKADAINEVLQLRRRGVRNIDVGCMQVNLQFHPEAFESLEDAFDPQRNAAYAAQFLRRLKDDSGSWTTAVGHYHSQTPERTYPYRRKVLQIWRDLDRESPTETMVAMTKPGPTAGERQASGSAGDRARRPLTAEEVQALRRDRLQQVRATLEARRDRIARSFDERRRAHDDFVARQSAVIEALRRYMDDQGRGRAPNGPNPAIPLARP